MDGGVSKNDFICQLLADLTGLNVERGKNSESSAFGAAYVAGINEGLIYLTEFGACYSYHN